MAELITVDDPADPRLADYLGLRDVRRREAHEAAAGLFIVEGRLAIERLMVSGRRPRSLLLLDTVVERFTALLAGYDGPALIGPRPLLEQVTGFDVHRGALAAADRWPLPSAAALLDHASTVAVLEGLNDAENMGAIFRTAAGLGVDAVLLSPGCCDPLTRRAIRVSMGEVLGVPFARLEPWPGALDAVRAAGFRLLALTPARDATSIDAVVRAPGQRLALLLGAEGPGLTAEVLAASDERVRIPLRADVDSLNVSHAAAIAFARLATP